MSILSRILPKRVDSRYRGHPLALWLFVPITLQKLALSVAGLALSLIGQGYAETEALHGHRPAGPTGAS